MASERPRIARHLGGRRSAEQAGTRSQTFRLRNRGGRGEWCIGRPRSLFWHLQPPAVAAGRCPLQEGRQGAFYPDDRATYPGRGRLKPRAQRSLVRPVSVAAAGSPDVVGRLLSDERGGLTDERSCLPCASRTRGRVGLSGFSRPRLRLEGASPRLTRAAPTSASLVKLWTPFARSPRVAARSLARGNRSAWRASSGLDRRLPW